MVIGKLSRLVNRRKKNIPQIPPGQRVYAIGDIHGRLDLFDEILGMIDDDDAARGTAEVHLILLGDLVDRGADSAGVVARAIELRASRPHFGCLKGNHEEVFLEAASGDAKATKFLVRIGGKNTLLSYGITLNEYNELEYEDLSRLLQERVPEEHLNFIQSCDDMIEVGDYLFVHAGIRPGVALEDQKPADLRWIRDVFLRYPGAHDRMVIHGHSITEEVDRRENRIGIDTGAYASGRLTAIGLQGQDCWFLSTGE